MSTTINPLTGLLDVASGVFSALGEAVTNLELALEADVSARRTAREAKDAYQDSESEFAAEALFAANGKNAEQRKAEVDVALVKARTSGPLAYRWQQMNAARNDADNAAMTLEQCSKRFRATEAAADLTAAMLKAASR